MKKYIFILFSIYYISIALSESVYISSNSESFVIDTVNPSVSILDPENGDSFNIEDDLYVSWSASDNLPLLDDSIEIFLKKGVGLLYESIALTSNSGYHSIAIQEFYSSAGSMFNTVKIEVSDQFGNKGYGYSSGYFTIGTPDNDYINEEIILEVTAISNGFVIDTKPPEVSVLHPNENINYLPGSVVPVSWQAYDDNMESDSLIISLISDYNVNGLSFGNNFFNDGGEDIVLPYLSTATAKIEVTVKDKFGYISKDVSDSYFSIGQTNDYTLEEEFQEFSALSTSFILDTKKPEFMPINPGSNDNQYFYPNGGTYQIFENYNNEPVEISYNVYDDSQEGAQLGVFQSYVLGGWYIPLDLNLPFDQRSAFVDLSKNGLIENSIWAKLKFRAIDAFGNVEERLIDDYYVLGDSRGDLDINWIDEEDLSLMINWGWEAKHAIMITKNAIDQYLSPGDKITLVDSLGIVSSSCDESYGYTELREITINDNGRIGGPKSVLRGIDHCGDDGQRKPGFIPGNPIIFKITNIADASYYFVYPSMEGLIGSSTYTAGGHTVVRNIDFANPISIDSNPSSAILVDGSRFDSFNVYYKTTNQGQIADLRDCDPSPADCGNSVCNDGDGNGVSDSDWCFEETVIGETDYQQQLAPMQTNTSVSYRVWLVGNSNTEIYKSVDDSIFIQISDLYDKSLISGWNWFSLNKTNDDMSINNILQSAGPSLIDDYGYIKSKGAFADYYSGFGWYGTLSDMDNLSAYKLDVNYPGNIIYEGTSVDVNTTPISISSGWNWISYLPQESMDINTAFASLSSSSSAGDYIKSQDGFADYYEGFGWYGILDTMNPTEGYMLDANNSGTLLYPESGSLSIASSSYDLSRQFDEFDNTDYEYNGSVTIAVELSDVIPQAGDKIRAYHNEQLRGVSNGTICPINNKLVFPMMFYGYEEGEELSFEYYNGSNEPIKLLETIQFIPDMHLNDALNPYIMSDEHPLVYSLSDAYPNPFNPSTTINYSIADNINDLSINVYDIRGRLVDRLYEGAREKGEYQFVWNASALSSGVYFIHMIAGEHVFTNKVMLVK